MVVERISINEIKVNPHNPRIIKDQKFKDLVKSLQDLPEMSEVRPLVVNEQGFVLGGNMRLKAMKEAGWKEAPVVKVDWPEERQREFVVKDNLSYGEWDWEALGNQYDIAELAEWGMDLPIELSGVNREDITEDEPPAVDRENDPQSKKGEVYTLGRHLVMCGDATSLDDLAVLMGGGNGRLCYY